MFKLARSPAATPSPAKLSKRPLGPQEPPPGSRDYAGDRPLPAQLVQAAEDLEVCWRIQPGRGSLVEKDSHVTL